MSRRQTNSTQNTMPHQPPRLRISTDEATAKIMERMDAGEQLKVQRIESPSDLTRLRQDKRVWHDYNQEMLRLLFDCDDLAAEYADPGIIFGTLGGGYTLQDGIDDLHKEVDKYLGKLRSIKERVPLFQQILSEPTAPTVSEIPPRRQSRRVFVVHGHDDGLKHAVARVLQALDLEPIILAEQPNGGQTIIEKFEAHSDVWFAVVLLTPDDVGTSKAEFQVDPNALKSRARQNVVLELGYFIGKLGRANVRALHKGNVELPSDVHGILYTPVQEGDNWRLQLGRELRAAGHAAGVNVDLNQLE